MPSLRLRIYLFCSLSTADTENPVSRRQSEKICTLLLNPIKSDARLNNMRVQNFSSYLTENAIHVHCKDQPF